MRVAEAQRTRMTQDDSDSDSAVSSAGPQAGDRARPPNTVNPKQRRMGPIAAAAARSGGRARWRRGATREEAWRAPPAGQPAAGLPFSCVGHWPRPGFRLETMQGPESPSGGAAASGPLHPARCIWPVVSVPSRGAAGPPLHRPQAASGHGRRALAALVLALNNRRPLVQHNKKRCLSGQERHSHGGCVHECVHSDLTSSAKPAYDIDSHVRT